MIIKKIIIREEKTGLCEKCNALVNCYAILSKPAKVLCFKHLHFGLPEWFKPSGLYHNLEADRTTFSYYWKDWHEREPSKKTTSIKGKLPFEPTYFNLFLFVLSKELNEKNKEVEV